MYDPARDTFTAVDDASLDDGTIPSDPPPADDEQPEASRSVSKQPVSSPSLPDDLTMKASDVAVRDEGPKTNKSSESKAPGQLRQSASYTSSPLPPDTVGNSRNRSGSVESPPVKSDLPEMSPPSKDDESPSMSKSQGARAADTAPHSAKRRRLDSESKDINSDYASPVPMNAANLPRFARKPRDETARKPGRHVRRPLTRDRSRSPQTRRRSRSGERHDGAKRRRERRSPSPIRRRSPTPPARSPPRKLKRPGGASRLGAAEKDAIQQRQREREEARIREAQIHAAARGVQDVVKQHYNMVPERGREWRKTDSRIRGLRSFNNWIKSTIIQKFSPNEDFTSGGGETTRWAEGMDGGGMEAERRGIMVLDIGCGKGGDLGKWQQAPQPVDFYVGVDPADVSITQARERFRQMRSGRGGRGGGGPRGGGRQQRTFDGEFFVKDAFGEWLGDIPAIREVGIDGSVGPGGGAASSRWGGGGFDVVSMMFCLHYAFENEEKARGMLRNVAGSLKKGGRLLGVIPNSDMLTEKVVQYHERKKRSSTTNTNGDGVSSEAHKPAEEEPKEEGEESEDDVLEWGNSIYRVRFPGKTPADGIFRPPFGWRYNYFMEEAVEAPEYVVPWEAFRAIAEDYNLELQYRRPFMEIWAEERDDAILGPLSERMGVRERGRGKLLVSEEELEACSFYLGFCFYKV
ncbi:MAG: mRNA cap guanine-N7 methyltransferase [Caeruleum heppii]|nr:MAG: mRNA cap guanine-N7 methyltransferase [Caeruleum heppii]